MTPSRTLLATAAVAAITFGVPGPDLKPTYEQSPLTTSYIVLAADEAKDDDTDTATNQAQSEENAVESAKMGEDAGTHTGNKATTLENDTKKVDQPPRKNPTSSN